MQPFPTPIKNAICVVLNSLPPTDARLVATYLKAKTKEEKKDMLKNHASIVPILRAILEANKEELQKSKTRLHSDVEESATPQPAAKKQKLETQSSRCYIDGFSSISIENPQAIRCMFTYDNNLYTVEKADISKCVLTQGPTGSKMHYTKQASVTSNESSISLCTNQGEIWTFYLYLNNIATYNIQQDKSNSIWSPQQLKSLGVAGHDPSTGKIALHGRSMYSVYDTNKKRWLVINKPCLLKRTHHSAIVFGSQLLVFGGEHEGTIYNDLWSYDFVKNEWQEVEIGGEQAPSPRKHAAFITTPDGKQGLLYGGTSNSGLLHDFWQFQFETQTWHRILIHHQIPPLSKPILCFRGESTVLIKGESKGIYTRAVVAQLNPVIPTITFEPTPAVELSSLLTLEMEHADTRIALLDGYLKAHRFVLKSHPSLKQFISEEESPETNRKQYLMDLSLLDISLETFRDFILPAIYQCPIIPGEEQFIQVIDAAKDLNLEKLEKWLIEVLINRLISGPVNLALSIIKAITTSKYATNYNCTIFEPFTRCQSKEKNLALAIQLLENTNITIPREMMCSLMQAQHNLQHPAPPPISQMKHPRLDKPYDISLTDRSGTVVLKSHRAVLSAWSEFFKIQLSGKFGELDNDHVIQLDCSDTCLRNLKCILYKQPHKLSKEDLLELFEVADFLKLEPLKEQLVGASKPLLDEEALISLYHVAGKMSRITRILQNSFDSATLDLLHSYEEQCIIEGRQLAKAIFEKKTTYHKKQ